MNTPPWIGWNMPAQSSSKFDHFVVIMFENRSFDNLLGYLYPPGEGRSFEGVLGRELANPIPAGLPTNGQNSVPVHPATDLDSPDPDPGEEYPHVNTQLFGTVEPPENREKPAKEMLAPFNAPPSGDATPTMTGFVADYVHSFTVELGRPPTYDEYSQIMACYTPDQIPVFSAIAKGFACFDHWFCEVPSQTFTNRSFFHAATSSGYVLDFPAENYVVRNTAPTIFERLEDAKLPWKVYVHPEQVVSITGLLHASRLAPYFANRFGTLFDFYAEAANGTLPAYAFIEPNLVPPRSDMHPPGFARLRYELHLPAPAAMRHGEQLLADVYNAVRQSKSPTGSNWKNTALLITFDEHGGTYDHVPPPRVPPPTAGGPPGQMGFKFDRAGVRIPTLLVSAWVDPGTVVNTEFRSTSVIRTLRERWGLGDPLTARDAGAADLAPVMTRETPRPPEEWPEITPIPVGRGQELLDYLDKPIGGLGRHIFEAAVAHEIRATGEKIELDPQQVTHRQAQAHLRKFRKAAFKGIQNGRME
jgi:phospholipase C